MRQQQHDNSILIDLRPRPEAESGDAALKVDVIVPGPNGAEVKSTTIRIRIGFPIVL
jgi:hypothetical protein